MSEFPDELQTYSLTEVSEMLTKSGPPVSVRTLKDYCRRGLLRGTKIGITWRVSQANLNAWLNAGSGKPALAAKTQTLEVRPQAGVTAEASPVARAEAALPDELRGPPQRAGAEPESGPPVESVVPLESRADRPAPNESVSGASTRTLVDFVLETGAHSGVARPPRRTRRSAGGNLMAADALAVLSGAGLARSRPVFASELPYAFTDEQGLPGAEKALMTSQVADEPSVATGGEPLNGPWRECYPNGQLRVEGAHRDGLQEGTWCWWDENGHKMHEGGHRAGRPHGYWTYYHPNGQRWCEGRYRDGEPDGPWRYWDADGKSQ
ncbi:MAG: helix-turn-helix domain-containing protein [Planctomycetes bacterium]|nr:helix-turn-helix domain-containing protein [Planctomycetota bacterium]